MSLLPHQPQKTSPSLSVAPQLGQVLAAGGTAGAGAVVGRADPEAPGTRAVGSYGVRAGTASGATLSTRRTPQSMQKLMLDGYSTPQRGQYLAGDSGGAPGTAAAAPSG